MNYRALPCRALVAAAVLGAFLAPAPAGAADAASKARASIQAAYKKMNAALARKDARAYLAFLAPDYQRTFTKGTKMNRTKTADSVRRMLAVAQSFKAATTLQGFSLQGGKAVARVKHHQETILFGAKRQRRFAVTTDVIAEDTWVRGAKGWLLKSTKNTEQKMARRALPPPGDNPRRQRPQKNP